MKAINWTLLVLMTVLAVASLNDAKTRTSGELSVRESMIFVNANFISAEECIGQIRRNKNTLLWGDIYVKYID